MQRDQPREDVVCGGPQELLDDFGWHVAPRLGLSRTAHTLQRVSGEQPLLECPAERHPAGCGPAAPPCWVRRRQQPSAGSRPHDRRRDRRRRPTGALTAPTARSWPRSQRLPARSRASSRARQPATPHAALRPIAAVAAGARAAGPEPPAARGDTQHRPGRRARSPGADGSPVTGYGSPLTRISHTPTRALPECACTASRHPYSLHARCRGDCRKATHGPPGRSLRTRPLNWADPSALGRIRTRNLLIRCREVHAIRGASWFGHAHIVLTRTTSSPARGAHVPAGAAGSVSKAISSHPTDTLLNWPGGSLGPGPGGPTPTLTLRPRRRLCVRPRPGRG